MQKRIHRGFWAKEMLQKLTQNEQSKSLACGHFIESFDYFEKEKLNLIKEFNSLRIEDDIYVLMHRENLM